jgi:hypothetical protein
VFFKKGWIEFSNYLVNEKNIYPKNSNFESFVENTINVQNEKAFDSYFSEMIFSEYHLYLGCLYQRQHIVKNILDQNRAIFALAWQQNSALQVHLGYLNQYAIKSDGVKIERNHTLWVQFNYTLKMKK